MNNKELLASFSKDQLIELIGIYSKNWLAMDGVWFQSVERKFGMDEAMFHDVEIWKRFTVTEARRIKAFLHLEEHPGLEGLATALRLRFYGSINEDSVELIYDNPENADGPGDGEQTGEPEAQENAGCQKAPDNADGPSASKNTNAPKASRLVYTMVDCRVQTARAKKGMEFHPCKPVGEVEYSGFAKEIDDRIVCRCLSCYPDITDTGCCCKWEFTYRDQ